jgi:hypothetical protein
MFSTLNARSADGQGATPSKLRKNAISACSVLLSVMLLSVTQHAEIAKKI